MLTKKREVVIREYYRDSVAPFIGEIFDEIDQLRAVNEKLQEIRGSYQLALAENKMLKEENEKLKIR